MEGVQLAANLASRPTDRMFPPSGDEPGAANAVPDSWLDNHLRFVRSRVSPRVIAAHAERNRIPASGLRILTADEHLPSLPTERLPADLPPWRPVATFSGAC